MLSYSFFEYCCGATEIGDLQGTAREVGGRIRTFIDGLQSDYDGDIVDSLPGMLIATTVPAQRGAMTALRNLKFRKVLTSINPGTGHEVTLWAKKLTYKK